MRNAEGCERAFRARSEAVTAPGKGGNATFAVGGVSGLLMQITPTGGCTWLLRVIVGGKRREIGLGGFPDVTLAQARERAREAKDKILNGIDPVEERREARAALVKARVRGLTFAEVTDRYLVAKLDGFRNAKHRQQWRNTLDSYALPHLGRILVRDIAVQDVLRVLEPIWQIKTETASRLRGRIEAVLSWATVAGHRTGDNPARWAGNLKELLPAPSKVAEEANHPAVQIADEPRWLRALQDRDGMGSRALEFTALTAARSQEVRGARWEEIDLEADMWIVPAARMKMGREHRVPLAPEAVALLSVLPRFESPLVFPASRGGEMFDMTLSAAMRRLHVTDVENGGRALWIGRASAQQCRMDCAQPFAIGGAEETHLPGDMAEVALAHKVGNAVEASYRCGDMVEKCREMMAEWAKYLTGGASRIANVVKLR